MNPISETSAISMEIGLSKEDQDKIEQLRTVDLDGTKKKKKKFEGTTMEKINNFFANFSKIKLREKVTFFQLLAVMINAGVPLIRSLYVLSDQNQNLKFKRIIREMAQTMEEGTSLSNAMNEHQSTFSESEIGMIASGEASGNLQNILVDIAKQAEKSAVIMSKVKGAMIYPAAILTIMSGALLLMLTMVVPKLTALFTDSGQELPTSTRALIAMSEYAQNSWMMLLMWIALAGAALIVFKKSKKGAYWIDMGLLYVPVFGKLVRQLMISRFARMLGSLMDAGLPIVKALEINAKAVGNEVYKKRIIYASQDVAQGIPLGENLSGDGKLFPPMVSSMVLVGEQSANLSEVSRKIADFYEGEVDTMVGALSKLMEPIILVVMGGMVGFIVAAIMQPIIALSDLSSVL